MKKIFNYIAVLSMLSLGVFTSCDKDSTGGETWITYYANIEINGGETVYLELGEEYTDEGATVTENGEEIDYETSSDVDVNTVGVYTVSYSATNTDGYSSSSSRTVIVYDPNSLTGLEGTYSGDVTRTAYSSGSTVSYSGNDVTLTATDATGLYEISDWIAGYYAVGYDYGDNYAFTGYIQITEDNEVVCVSEDDVWSGGVANMDGTYDPLTGVISFNFDWYSGSYNFAVDLTPAE